MDFFERLKGKAWDHSDNWEPKDYPHPVLPLIGLGIDATIEALKEIVESHDFWEWITSEYDALKWATDVLPSAVRSRRISAIQMLGLVVRLLAGKEDPVAQQINLKEFCEICNKVTEWKFYCHQRDERGAILFTLHNCVECGGTRKLSGRSE